MTTKQENYTTLLKLIKFEDYQDQQNYMQILIGIKEADLISKELWDEILKNLDKIEPFCWGSLTDFATKQFFKYPDQSTHILVEVLKKSHNYNSSNSKYYIEDFLKKLARIAL